jgi:hypothetical protein
VSTCISCQCLPQVVHDSHTLQFQLRVKEAMEPEDLLWRNAGIGQEERQTRRNLGYVADFWVLALWSIPVAAIQGLCSVESVSEHLPFLVRLPYRHSDRLGPSCTS